MSNSEIIKFAFGNVEENGNNVPSNTRVARVQLGESLSAEIGSISYDKDRPKYRIQLMDADTREVLDEFDVLTAADCVSYVNKNKLLRDNLGFKAGTSINATLQELFDALLYPCIEPSFKIVYLGDKDTKVLNDGDIIYAEKGKKVSPFDLRVNITAGSEDLVKCELMRNLNDTIEVLSSFDIDVKAGEKSSILFPVNQFSNNQNLYFRVIDSTDKGYESFNIKFEFVQPVIIGYVDKNLKDMSDDDINKYLSESPRENIVVEKNTDIKGHIVSKCKVTYSYPFIMIPRNWNLIKNIKDQNGLDLTRYYWKFNNAVITDRTFGTVGYVAYICRLPIRVTESLDYLKYISYNFSGDDNADAYVENSNATPVMGPLQVLSTLPLDNRTVVETYDDLKRVKNPYEGLIVYVKDACTYYKCNKSLGWEIYNTSFRFFNSSKMELKDSMGSSGDIFFDLDTGSLYQKSKHWNYKCKLKLEE